MVASQIRPNRVTDERLMEAMARVPREAFVPGGLQGVAYVDEALPLGNGRYLMEPLVAARLIQAAEPGASDLALVVGCATGYTAAVLAHLVGTVVAVESDAGMVNQVAATLSGLGINTVAVIEGSLNEGCADQAPFDVVLFDGAVGEIPDAVIDQLADGGRLVAVVRGPGGGPGGGSADADGMGKAVLVTRHRGVVSRRQVFDAGTPPLPGFEPAAGFVF